MEPPFSNSQEDCKKKPPPLYINLTLGPTALAINQLFIYRSMKKLETDVQ